MRPDSISDTNSWYFTTAAKPDHPSAIVNITKRLFLSPAPNTPDAYAANPNATNAISVATAPTHTPVTNPAAIVVTGRRIIVARVTITTTRCYGCGDGTIRISMSRSPTIEGCSLGAFKGKKRRCDQQGGGNCSYAHLIIPFGYCQIRTTTSCLAAKHSGETRKESSDPPLTLQNFAHPWRATGHLRPITHSEPSAILQTDEHGEVGPKR